ncbi:MAG: peptidoglycan DD-metalloendopeptidase family protein [Thermoleophilaceae bacterium]|nr:peptidoglycan DD-metalloendopeptidase family protein [Thermoleophilaceae bacterium]
MRHSRIHAGGAAVALGVCGLAAGPTALAQSGGGGAVFVAKPEISKVACVRRCGSKKRAQGGSTLRITGSALDGVVKIVFRGSHGSSDDTSARVRGGSSKRLSVRVPIGAVSGPLSAMVSRAVQSPPTEPVAILPPPPPEPNTELSPVPGVPQLETGTSRTKAFVDARRAVTFSFRLSGAAPSDVAVELVRAADGAAVKTWHPAPEPDAVTDVSWNGRIGSSGARPGRYSFRLTASGGSGATVRSAGLEEATRDTFDLYDNMFPIRGRHNYGQSGARFGTGRAGHSHQGQDVFARCGTPLVAARGGRVKFKQYHAAAGYYLVIDAAGTGEDYAYMHMAEPSPFSPGDRVYTGQRIGAVGDTGNARGCHLHFELWRAPGWYDGGKPFDPLPSLKAWDAWS